MQEDLRCHARTTCSSSGISYTEKRSVRQHATAPPPPPLDEDIHKRRSRHRRTGQGIARLPAGIMTRGRSALSNSRPLQSVWSVAAGGRATDRLIRTEKCDRACSNAWRGARRGRRRTETGSFYAGIPHQWHADKYRHLGQPIHLAAVEFSKKISNLAALRSGADVLVRESRQRPSRHRNRNADSWPDEDVRIERIAGIPFEACIATTCVDSTPRSVLSHKRDGLRHCFVHGRTAGYIEERMSPIRVRRSM